MSGIIGGLVGGVIAAGLTAWIASRVGKGGRPGQLRYGAFMWGLAVVSLVFALLPVVVSLHRGDSSEFWAKTVLFVGFGVGAIYCFGEVAFVKGEFDEEGIVFHTPWTGTKRERWEDLVSAEPNAWLSWYTLTFASGRKVRLSTFLTGHLSALEAARSR